MATKTKNYQFIKPDLTDDADIRVINENFDTLDTMIFQSGELGNHTGDSDAHKQIFAKYLPLAGGTMTGTIDATNTTTNLGYTTFNKNVYMQGSNSLRFADDSNFNIHNGYGKTYGANISFTGNDVTNSNYIAYKNNVRVKASESNTKFTQLRVAPGGIEITRGENNSNKFDLKVPEFTANHITSYQSTAVGEDNYFIQSYNGRCAIDFRDVNNNPDSQYIKIKVNDNVIKIDDSGVFYNDKLSLFIEEYSEKTETLTPVWGLAGGVTVTSTTIRYANGTMIILYRFTKNTTTESGTVTWTFPIPFTSSNFYWASESLYTAGDVNGTVDSYEDLVIMPTVTGAKFYMGTHCDVSGIIRGRWK